MRALRRGRRGDVDTGDHFARCQDRFDIRGSSGNNVKFLNSDSAFSARAGELDACVEGEQGDPHVAGVAGDAVVAGAEDRQHPVLAVDRRTAGARDALVAGETSVAEVAAACTLQQVAAHRGHVADLRRGGGQQRLRQHRPASHHVAVLGHVGHAGQWFQVQPIGVGVNGRGGQALKID